MSQLEPRRSASVPWRSLRECLPEEPATQDPGAMGPTAMGRRRFLGLLGATAAVGAAGCDRLGERGRLQPYVAQPEGTPPGTARLYASSLPACPGAPPILAVTREGRPVKLEGNPEHPASAGGLGAWGQAATLTLYDPDRVRTPLHRGAPATWDEADAAVRAALQESAASGRRVLLFTPTLVSPTARQLVARFVAAYPGALHLPIEGLHGACAAAGRAQVLGWDGPLRVDWNRADVVLCLEADPLGPLHNPGDQRAVALRRQPDSGAMSRLWCVEAGVSITGANADHRLPLRPSRQARLLLGLLQAAASAPGAPAAVASLASELAPHAFPTAAETDLPAPFVRALVQDLLAHRGRSVVLAGDALPSALHALASALNLALSNVGSTQYPAGGISPSVATAPQVAAAVAALQAGRVGVVIDLGANPAYALPLSCGVTQALGAAPTLVSHCLVPDETAQAAAWVLPAAHDLESWGDVDLHPDVLTLQQPTMRPLFEARQREQALLSWLPGSQGEPTPYQDYLRDRWHREVYPALAPVAPFSDFWNAALHDGFVATPAPRADLSLQVEGMRAAMRSAAATSSQGMDLVLAPSYQVHDGRFANCGWLQEMPHPITSVVWGNAALLGVATARRLGLRSGDAVRVEVEGRSIEVPAVLLPGQAEETVQIDLGWGRRCAGSVGTAVGVDAGRLRTLGGGLSPWLYAGAAVQRTGGRLRVVRTQGQHSLEGRNHIVEGTLEQLRADPLFVATLASRDASPSPGRWQYRGAKWGMVIDLTACTGCNSCLVACQAENNVPVVGPDQVARGRAMHWIRVDRYYGGDVAQAAQVRLAHQPMLCQHCDNAPCENVCPVAATSHSPDGLNEMTYNRCVGTRYCANNCPFKVRRFNYLATHQDPAWPRQLAFNPEVTVRSRGVMEKCTFCVQHLRGRSRGPGEEPVTACQQACPTGAIAFGDLNDAASRVSQLAASSRGYHVLAELGVRPSITYLARIRNLHPDLRT